MTDTPRLALGELVAAQSQKHVTVNEALIKLDALIDLTLTSMSVSDPPSSPADGDAYLVAAGGTGAWSGYDGKIAYCIDGTWMFYAPFVGQRAHNRADGRNYRYCNGAWTEDVASTGVTAGTYTSTTVDAKGRVIGGTNPTTLAGYGITDAPHIEIGTFTPVLKGSLTDPTGVTYGTQEGAYMKIGPWCIVHMWVTWSAITAIGSGDFEVTLPVAPISYADTGAIRAYVDATVNVTSIQTRVAHGDARLCYSESPGGYVWSANTRSAGQFAGTLVYKWS